MRYAGWFRQITNKLHVERRSSGGTRIIEVPTRDSDADSARLALEQRLAEAEQRAADAEERCQQIEADVEVMREEHSAALGELDARLEQRNADLEEVRPRLQQRSA